MVLPLTNPTKSYWIEAAESPLRDFRSTPELPQETDVVIIGSGYTGTTTAYWIQKFTQKSGTTPQMLMLEARDVCGGATGRNGGQLRPHAYSRYPKWSDRFGSGGALALIKHEMAHLDAFKQLAAEEGIAEEICLKFGETFDAAMTEEAWKRLKGAYESMKRDHGENGDVIRECRLIEDPKEAEEFTQMKGAVGAVVHPAGQVWPYKFIHALLRIVLDTGKLNLQAHTPALAVSARDEAGWITVKTARGDVRAKAVVHATNRWASHLLPEFTKVIYASRATLAAVKAPEGFIKHTGAQHWDDRVNNYHLQLPPPYNTIVVGGAKQVLVHHPDRYIRSDEEDKRIDGVAELFATWPKSDIVGWEGPEIADLARPVDEGGCWTGTESSSSDSFPFVGTLPSRDGHFIAAGFTGHGMPRILLSTAHITPLVLKSLGINVEPPALVAPYPTLPEPFAVSPERIERAQRIDADAALAESIKGSLQSAKKPFCNGPRFAPWTATAA